jgi:hypothetical protein
VKWTGRDGTLYEHHYEMVVEAARGFSVPFVSEAYRENAGALQVIGTIETECVDYGANTWGPKATVSTSFFTTPNGPGKSVTKIVLENVQLNVPIADSELMVAQWSMTGWRASTSCTE